MRHRRTLQAQTALLSIVRGCWLKGHDYQSHVTVLKGPQGGDTGEFKVSDRFVICKRCAHPKY